MKFGQYELQDRIAVGGMAEVYRGRAAGEEGFVKHVAIKRVLPSYAQDARFVTMLLTEARIHAHLQHRNIVQIHDLGVSEEGEYFIVLEYVDGRDLAGLLEALRAPTGSPARPARLPDAVALHVAIELGEGAHYAHELRAEGQALGLVHRDISPSNVLVSYAGEVKLSDFGLAKRRTDQSVVGSLKGKLAYMSPEQARRTPLDRRSDIFALGAVLYEMVTGQRLREIKDEASGWQQVASGIVPPARGARPDLPPAIDRLLARALAPDPRDRFPDARAFVAEARAALDLVPRTRAGEAVELAEILKRALPPGSPRPSMEASKVIRFRSEVLPERLPGGLRAAAGPRESAPPAATTAVTTIARAPERPAAVDAVTRVAPQPTRGRTPVPAAPEDATPAPRPAPPAPVSPAVGARSPSGRFPSLDGGSPGAPRSPSGRFPSLDSGSPAAARSPSGRFPSLDGGSPGAPAYGTAGAIPSLGEPPSGPRTSPLVRVPADRIPSFDDSSSSQTLPGGRPASDRPPRFDDSSSAPTSPALRRPAGQPQRFDDSSSAPTSPALRPPAGQPQRFDDSSSAPTSPAKRPPGEASPRFDDSSSAPTAPALKPPSGRFAALGPGERAAPPGNNARPSGALPAVVTDASGSPGSGSRRAPADRGPTPSGPLPAAAARPPSGRFDALGSGLPPPGGRSPSGPYAAVGGGASPPRSPSGRHPAIAGGPPASPSGRYAAVAGSAAAPAPSGRYPAVAGVPTPVGPLPAYAAAGAGVPTPTGSLPRYGGPTPSSPLPLPGARPSGSYPASMRPTPSAPLPLPAGSRASGSSAEPYPIGGPRRMRPRPPARGRVALAALALAGAAVAAVHVLVVPLPVVAVWGEPLRIEIVSEPPGADVILDGTKISAPTPVALEVPRDLGGHVLEVRKEGYRGTRQAIRFDKNLELRISVALDPKSRPAVLPLGSVGGSPAPAPAQQIAPAATPAGVGAPAAAVKQP